MKLKTSSRNYLNVRIITLSSLITNIFLIIYTSFKTMPQYVQQVSSQLSILERVQGPLKPEDEEVIKLIKATYLIPPSTLNYNFNSTGMYKYYTKELSWKFINTKLKTLFLNEPPGFFVEAGALDGELLSNTLWLERDKSWTGLLIEPDSVNFASLVKKNRKSWSSKSCLSTTPYPKLNTFAGYSPSKEISKDKSLDWFARSLTNELDHGLKLNNPYFNQEVYNTLQCFPLESFLYALNITVVDFLSLDIQGGEMEVLELFPWDKITLRVLAVEYYGRDGKLLSKEFMSFMNEKNYTLIGVSEEPDYIYVKNNDRLLKKVL